jgi:hypothetical protein
MLRISTSSIGALALTQIALSGTAALGQEKLDESRFAAGITAGTLGVGVEASYFINPYLVARANVTGLSFNYGSLLSGMGIDSSNYDFTLKEFSAGGLIDIHPFRNGFRGAIGARYADFNFSQSRTDKVAYSINGVTYTNAQVGALNTTVTVKNQFAPYVGFGWDSAHHFSSVRDAADWTGDKFTVSFDLGALYTGGVNVDMTTDRKPTPNLSTDLVAESQHLRNAMNKIYSFYPVAMTTFKYRF